MPPCGVLRWLPRRGVVGPDPVPEPSSTACRVRAVASGAARHPSWRRRKPSPCHRACRRTGRECDPFLPCLHAGLSAWWPPRHPPASSATAGFGPGYRSRGSLGPARRGWAQSLAGCRNRRPALAVGPANPQCASGGIAVLHDLRRLSLHVSHLLTMTGGRHLRTNAARRPNGGSILACLLLFAVFPFIVSGGADVVEEPVDALADPRHGDDQPFFELADQGVPLGFEHGHFTLVFGKAADVLFGRPETLLVGDAQVLVEFRHERNRLHSHLLEQVHGGGVPLKPFRKTVQTFGDFRQNLGRGFHLSGGGVETDAHST